MGNDDVQSIEWTCAHSTSDVGVGDALHRLVAKFVFKHIGGKSAQFGIFNIEEESGFILLW